MEVSTQETRIILAIKAICISKKLSLCKAIEIYNIPCSTLTNRINIQTSIHDRRPAVQKLIELEEKIII